MNRSPRNKTPEVGPGQEKTPEVSREEDTPVGPKTIPEASRPNPPINPSDHHPEPQPPESERPRYRSR